MMSKVEEGKYRGKEGYRETQKWNLGVTSIFGRHAWEPGNTTKSNHIANLSQEIYWEGKTQGSGCLCLGEKHWRTGQKKKVYIGFLGARVTFQGGLELEVA